MFNKQQIKEIKNMSKKEILEFIEYYEKLVSNHEFKLKFAIESNKDYINYYSQKKNQLTKILEEA